MSIPPTSVLPNTVVSQGHYTHSVSKQSTLAPSLLRNPKHGVRTLVHQTHMGKNFQMCINAYFFEKKSELSELHYVFNLLEAKTLLSGSKILLTPLHVWFLYWPQS